MFSKRVILESCLWIIKAQRTPKKASAENSAFIAPALSPNCPVLVRVSLLQSVGTSPYIHVATSFEKYIAKQYKTNMPDNIKGILNRFIVFLLLLYYSFILNFFPQLGQVTVFCIILKIFFYSFH